VANTPLTAHYEKPERPYLLKNIVAGDGNRTRDAQLGKLHFD